MRKQLTIAVVALATLASLWVAAVQSQTIQCGGSFVPSLNCVVSGRWNYTNITSSVNSNIVTQGPIPFQAGGQDVTGIVSRVTTLSNANMLVLHDTPITVVPAPGPGFFIDVIGVQIIFNYTTAYTGTASMRLWYTNAGTGPAASESITASGLIVSVTADASVRVLGTPSNTGPLTANAAVVIQSSGANYGGGAAANSVRVVVHYRIVPTGL